MKDFLLFMLLAAGGSPCPVAAQTPQQPSTTHERAVSWKLLLPNLMKDQARIWSFPSTVVKGHHLVPTVGVVGASTGLMFLDPTQAAWFRQTATFHGFNHIFTGQATGIATFAVPVSLYGIGLIRKDSKMTRTALLAGEAVADAEILTTVFKDTTRRVRPAAIPDNTFNDSWFETKGGSVFRGNGSFPSGHTIAAFSIATIVARRYGNHRWVPWVAYGMAATVGFSRISLSAHFAADVFVGGVFGYSISRYAVLRQ